MIVFAREVFLCKCPTDVRSSPGEGAGRNEISELRFVSGDESHLGLLDAEAHGSEHIADFRTRLARGEHWLLGLCGERIVTYTWLHTRPRCEYPYLPGCAFSLSDRYGYGYDAWTPPALRSQGLRRRAFVEELRVLAGFGKTWEASFFVAYQLDSARRSLARVGITIAPLWRVRLGPDRRPQGQCLAPEEVGARPCFA
jgi:hypothetical protein